jgi:hypothetical protein
LGGAALAVVLLVALLLWLVLRTPNTPRPSSALTTRPTIFVNKLGKYDSVTSLDAALQRLRRSGNSLGGRIVLQHDINEEGVLVSGMPNVTIEGEAGRTIAWRAPDKVPSKKLLTAFGSPQFHLKGLTIDGGGRAEVLVNAGGESPGMTLEDLTLKGFTKYGIWVTNCKGEPGPDQQVLLSRLQIDTDKPPQVALQFEILPKVEPGALEHVVVRDVTFGGPGVKVRAPAAQVLDKVELQPGTPKVFGQ